MRVLTLLTCRNPSLLRMATLVFDTLRIGFPTAHIKVFLNRSYSFQSVHEACCKVDAEKVAVDTIHHDWIGQMVSIETEPFWLLDTDVIFYENFERFNFNGPIAGYRIPEFKDEVSGCITRARLHPSLLYVNPALVKESVGNYLLKTWGSVFTPEASLINPLKVPLKRRVYFYDTCSMLYHAIGGEAFTEIQKDAYLHLHYGSISDLILDRMPKAEAESLRKRRETILNNPALGRGAWREQEEYWSNRQP